MSRLPPNLRQGSSQEHEQEHERPFAKRTLSPADTSRTAILQACERRVIVTPEAGSRPVGPRRLGVQLAARPPRFGSLSPLGRCSRVQAPMGGSMKSPVAST